MIRTSEILTSKTHIEPLRDEGFVIYPIAYIGPVINGKREAYSKGGNIKGTTTIDEKVRLIDPFTFTPMGQAGYLSGQYFDQYIDNGTGRAIIFPIKQEKIITQIAHGFEFGNAIKRDGAGAWIRAKANNRANAGTVGIVSNVIDADNFEYLPGGLLPGDFVDGACYFLSPYYDGQIFVQSDPEVWTVGQIREFIGTGTAQGLEIEIDLGDEIIDLQDLKGPQGAQGSQGAQGNIGSQGSQGTAGIGLNLLGEKNTPADLPSSGNSAGDCWNVASDGHLYAWNNANWVDVGQIRGPQGPQGSAGSQGNQGAQGSGGAQGNQGVQGAGTQGPQGNIGPQGVQGSDGQQGYQGTQGIRGYQGNQGNQGIQGVQGNQGYQGSQGATSTVQGPQGNQGSQGSQGVVGAGYTASSSSSVSAGTGFKYFTVQSGLAYSAGARVRAYTGGSVIILEGICTSYTGNQLTIFVDRSVGSGSASSWTINLAGEVGTQGAQGYQGVQGAGSQGPQGYQGVQGTQGPQGVRGSIGMGLQGPQGYQGASLWTDAGAYIYPTQYSDAVLIGAQTRNYGTSNILEVIGSSAFSGIVNLMSALFLSGNYIAFADAHSLPGGLENGGILYTDPSDGLLYYKRSNAKGGGTYLLSK